MTNIEIVDVFLVTIELFWINCVYLPLTYGNRLYYLCVLIILM